MPLPRFTLVLPLMALLAPAHRCAAGTVMRGGIRVGDTVELPELRVAKKVKSMQMFRWG